MKKSNFDAIFIPGGGLERNGAPHKWVTRRLDKAIELYTGREFLIPLGQSTPHKPPPRDKKGFPIDESFACARYLARRGVPRKRILMDRFSDDTIGNGYFSRLLFSDPFGFKRIMIITSVHHMPRVKTIFRWIYRLTPRRRHYRLDFIEVSDQGLNPRIIASRIKKEKKGLRRLLPLTKKIGVLDDLSRWLFTRHAVYAYGLKVGSISRAVIKTY